MTFEKFFCELISDEIWHEFASKNHRPETFKKVAEQVYTLGLADREAFAIIPIREHRTHLTNKLAKIQPDKVKVNWWEIEQKKKEAEEKKEEWVPLTGEERQKRLAEFKAMIDSINVNFVAPKMSHKEMAHLGGWDKPKPEDYKPTAYDKISIALESKNKIRQCRKKVFLEAFPDASEEEIRAYWEKFEDTKEETI